MLGLIVKISSPGPALYSQVRLGKGGRLFRIYKFRTMTHNCEAASGAVWASVNDPRITSLGRLLRDTHLDELPQLWNVLRGDMSLIGPRPERPELATEIEKVVPDFSQRLLVRPGLTGLAQMRLPADRELKRVSYKLEQDLLYIRDVSLALDLRIILCTVLVILESGCGSIARLLLGHYSAQATELLAVERQHLIEASCEPVDPELPQVASGEPEQILVAA